jgi:hypothetical protein
MTDAPTAPQRETYQSMSLVTLADGQVYERRITPRGNVVCVRPGQEPLMTEEEFLQALRGSVMSEADDPERLTAAPDAELDELLSKRA